MTFWLFSGCDQKSGALICSSVLASWDCRWGASKIAPHSVGLLAERVVFAIEFVERHEPLSYSMRYFPRHAWRFPSSGWRAGIGPGPYVA